MRGVRRPAIGAASAGPPPQVHTQGVLSWGTCRLCECPQGPRGPSGGCALPPHLHPQVLYPFLTPRSALVNSWRLLACAFLGSPAPGREVLPLSPLAGAPAGTL